MTECECGGKKSPKAARCRSCAQRARWTEGQDARRQKLEARNLAARGGRPYDDPEWMRARYEDDGLSYRQIAVLSASTLRTISRWMKVHGIPPRAEWELTAARSAAMKRKRGPASHYWKGGRTVDSGGYVKVIPPDDLPFEVPTDASRYIAEHRLVMALAVGRPLLPGETVHHIDGDRANNRLDNLQLRQGNHGSGVVMTCADCGSHNVTARRIASD